jgi:dienelactone hydrolase
MSITYQCEQCGQWHTVREGKVGTRARCKVCDHEMTVPSTPDLFDDAIDGPRGGAAPPQWRAQAATAPVARPAASPPGDEVTGKLWGGGLGVAGFVLFLVFRIAFHGGMGRLQRRPGPGPMRPQIVVQQPRVDLNAPVELPQTFPDLGPPREVERGVELRQVELHDAQPALPGHSGKLWLYTPTTRAARPPASLPCVLIAPAAAAANSFLTGMKLTPDARPEHLPYVRAGFAVLAFELDGADAVPNPQGMVAVSSIQAFLQARAGLVNGEVARAFLKAKVPEVDLGRLYVAGHGSAATFALLFAEYTHFVKGCIAYAPAIDRAARVDVVRAARIRRFGLGDLFTRFSPRAGESKLSCPVFLFHARDDGIVPFEETEAFAERLRSMDKPVTLELVDDGDHYNSMIKQGIPRGVAWLKARDAEVRVLGK